MNNKKSGMTLLEILIGFTILSLGATSVLAFLVFFIKINVTILDNLQTKYIAEEFSERIRAESFRSPLILNDGDNADLDEFTEPDHSAADTLYGRVFHRYWNIVDDEPMDGMKTIKVRIMYDKLDKNQIYEFTTLKGSG
ncbi:type II secretion system protein [bacterium]|nr:type II secretion system protein [bacterium]